MSQAIIACDCALATSVEMKTHNSAMYCIASLSHLKQCTELAVYLQWLCELTHDVSKRHVKHAYGCMLVPVLQVAMTCLALCPAAGQAWLHCKTWSWITIVASVGVCPPFQCRSKPAFYFCTLACFALPAWHTIAGLCSVRHAVCPTLTQNHRHVWKSSARLARS